MSTPKYTLLIGQNSLSEYNAYSVFFPDFAQGPSLYLNSFIDPPTYHPFCCSSESDCLSYLSSENNWQGTLSPTTLETGTWTEPPSYAQLALYLTPPNEADWSAMMSCLTATDSPFLVTLGTYLANTTQRGVTYLVRLGYELCYNPDGSHGPDCAYSKVYDLDTYVQAYTNAQSLLRAAFPGMPELIQVVVHTLGAGMAQAFHGAFERNNAKMDLFGQSGFNTATSSQSAPNMPNNFSVNEEEFGYALAHGIPRMWCETGVQPGQPYEGSLEFLAETATRYSLDYFVYINSASIGGGIPESSLIQDMNQTMQDFWINYTMDHAVPGCCPGNDGGLGPIPGWNLPTALIVCAAVAVALMLCWLLRKLSSSASPSLVSESDPCSSRSEEDEEAGFNE